MREALCYQYSDWHRAVCISSNGLYAFIPKNNGLVDADPVARLKCTLLNGALAARLASSATQRVAGIGAGLNHHHPYGGQLPRVSVRVAGPQRYTHMGDARCSRYAYVR